MGFADLTTGTKALPVYSYYIDTLLSYSGYIMRHTYIMYVFIYIKITYYVSSAIYWFI